MVRKIDREIYDPDGIILDQIKAGAADNYPLDLIQLNIPF
ncbi:MAG: hypothetical protein Ct9H90mP4_06550 [Gammaproteobacteria bacterium]|nr:MAG: hypothetical protein Ct9H90mP4_06550 [Gammaproteobacteria bacterium]